MKPPRIFLLFLATLLPLFVAAQSEALHTRAELVSDITAVAPGQTFWLALRLESQPHWHTYWQNPGEAGFATELIWEEKPAGVTIDETFLWPAPIVYLQAGIVNYVYEGEVFLLLRARTQDSIKAGETLRFKARADWLECDERGCWPGSAEVALVLPVVTDKTQARPSQWAQKISQTGTNLPRALPQWTAGAERTASGAYLLTLRPAASAATAGVGAASAADTQDGATGTAAQTTGTSTEAQGASTKVAKTQNAPTKAVLSLAGVGSTTTIPVVVADSTSALSVAVADSTSDTVQTASGFLKATAAKPSPAGEKFAATGESTAAGKPTVGDETSSAVSASAAATETIFVAGASESHAIAANLAVKPLYFFPLTDAIAPAAMEARQVSVGADGTVTVLLNAGLSVDTLEQIEGVFTAANGWLADGSAPALAVSVAVGAGGQGIASLSHTAGAGGTQLSLHLLGLAFVGGLILNLMPCVFPVLGIKVLGFVQQAGSERHKVVLHGLYFTLGVLISFWVLSGVLIGLRAGGAELGWGFQLQSPVFVSGLTVLLLVFGLSLSGLFDIGYGAMNVGSGLAAKSGLKGSFFSGVLATVVATPCAAPFLAPALGAALALPAVDSLVVFTAVALGLAAPYLILSTFPALVKWLPRPGAWMETFKQLMAFLLYATVAYLLWTLAGLVGEEWFLNILFGLVAVAAACWAYGRWLKPGTKLRVRGWFVTIVFAALGGWLVFTPVRPLQWEDWSPQRVAELQAQGRPVYVDFTARWCATCQVNKRVVFGSDEVLERFKKDRVAMLKADWTDRNAAITAELAKYGRSAVPFNLLYGGKAGEEPLILPELLTPAIVLEALTKVQER